MNVVIDTNIYRQDLAARSARFDILLDYVRKTDSNIVLPRLVLDELLAHLTREVRDRVTRAQAVQRDLSRLMPHRVAPPPELRLDIDKEMRDYTGYLLGRLSVKPTQIVDYKDAYLRDVLTRAIQRLKPCSPDGEEIRDAVLWLTVLDVAESAPDRTVVFISQNKKQFADPNDLLHPDLLEECGRRGVKVKYFPSLEDFAKQHAQQVAFATRDWLQKNISDDEVFEMALDGILRIANRAFERRRDSDDDFGGDSEVVGGGVSDPDLFVYEMTDGSFRIEASYFGEAEVSFSVYRPAASDDWSEWDYHYGHSGPAYRSSDRERSWRTIEVECAVRVEASVRDEKVVSWSVTDVESY